jgi:hypothetical protein
LAASQVSLEVSDGSRVYRRDDHGVVDICRDVSVEQLVGAFNIRVGDQSRAQPSLVDTNAA